MVASAAPRPFLKTEEECYGTKGGRPANGQTHANGEVFDTLSLNYTVAQLEAQNLWTRMDAKIAGFGGCAHVP